MSVQINTPEKITIGDNTYNIKVEYKHKKNSSATLNKDTIHIRIPWFLPKTQKNKHIEHLIQSMQKKISKHPKKITFKQVLEAGYFKIANDKYTIIPQKNRQKLHYSNNTFYINPKEDINSLEKKIQKKLCEIYHPVIKEKIDEINNQTLNYTYKSLTVKIVSSLWGHCTRDNKIMINLKILNASEDIIKYLIIHELSHISIKNHSPKFWRLVQTFCPNYKKLRKNLKDHPPELYKL